MNIVKDNFTGWKKALKVNQYFKVLKWYRFWLPKETISHNYFKKMALQKYAKDHDQYKQTCT